MTSVSLSPEDRARVYLWFARAFSYPDEERFDEMKALSEILPGDLSEKFIQWIEELEEQNFQDIEADYVTLFISGFPRTVAPPYESVYKDEGLVMGPSTEEVIEYYSKYGLEPAEESSLPDSLPIELEFMGFLLQNYPDENDTSNFFKEHLISWAYDFIEKVVNSEYPIYKGLAGLLKNFLKEEEEIFS